MWDKFKFFRVFIFLALMACEKNTIHSENPQGRLTNYISESFNIQSIQDKNRLLDYLMGDVKTRLERWSDDQFKENFIDSKRKFSKLILTEVKVISSKEVQITYDLVFFEELAKKALKSDNEKLGKSKITQKKLCQMIFTKGKWYIANVKNIKELIEYEDVLSLP